MAVIGACARTQSGRVWCGASDGAFKCSRCYSRIGQDERFGSVVFGRATVAWTVVILILKKIDRALFCALFEPLSANCKEDDKRKGNCADNATNHTANYSADVYM